MNCFPQESGVHYSHTMPFRGDKPCIWTGNSSTLTMKSGMELLGYGKLCLIIADFTRIIEGQHLPIALLIDTCLIPKGPLKYSMRHRPTLKGKQSSLLDGKSRLWRT